MNRRKSSNGFSLVVIEDTSEKKAVGFCYEYAIVKYGSDAEHLKKELLEASKGYYNAVVKSKSSPNLLNRSDELPAEFKQVYKFILAQTKNRKVLEKEVPRKYKNAFAAGNAYLVPACA
jgi:hypothetical protein